MKYDIRVVSTYPPRRCGIGTFSRDLADALQQFPNDVRRIRVAVIDNSGCDYDDRVDMVIDQYDPQSWAKATAQITSGAFESDSRPVALLQHEYGLDPEAGTRNANGTNYVEMAKRLSEKGVVTLVYLHTVLDDPDEHQKKVLQDLAEHSEGLIVTTESAVDILTSETYGIRRSRITHIDHGIRMQNPFQYDRLMVKEECGLANGLLITTLGLRSPDKGIQYSVRGYAKFLRESCSQQQRSNLVYLIAGQCHPEFIAADEGTHYRLYQKMMGEALEDSELKCCEVKDLGEADFAQYDVVFLDTFLDESMLLKLYGATNVMVLPYLNMQQMSSGVLADTVGSGRVAIATKFRYAVELIKPGSIGQKGIIVGPGPRGILVDPGEESVEQIAQGLDYVVFNRDQRLGMEKRAHRRGYQMKWDNTAWQLLQYIQFVIEKRETVSGRGIEFARERASIFEEQNSRLSAR